MYTEAFMSDTSYEWIKTCVIADVVVGFCEETVVSLQVTING